MKKNTVYVALIILVGIYAILFGVLKVEGMQASRPINKVVVQEPSPIVGTVDGLICDRNIDVSHDSNGHIELAYYITLEKNKERVNFEVSDQYYKQLLPGTYVKISYTKEMSIYKIEFPNMDSNKKAAD